jgi:lytic cellulose monooxygenase (C1-hydroxylating)
MRFTSVVSAFLLAGSATAHTRLLEVWVNGVDQGDGRTKYIRSPPNDDPVKDLRSPTMACNVGGDQPASGFVKAAAGDKITFEWYHESRGDMIIDPSHMGPIITYISQYTDSDGSGPRWSKIAQQGYEGGVWAVEKLIENKGKVDITIPSALAAGKYLIRQEIIAHHESFEQYDLDPINGAQFYPVCVQFDVSGTGTAVPSDNFDFNPDKGGYQYTDPGIHFDMYGSFSSYTIPGPGIWAATGGGSGSGNGTTPANPPTSTTAPESPDNGTPDSPVVTPVPTDPITVPSGPDGGSPTDSADPPVRTGGSCSGRRRKSRKCRNRTSQSSNYSQ